MRNNKLSKRELLELKIEDRRSKYNYINKKTDIVKKKIEPIKFETIFNDNKIEEINVQKEFKPITKPTRDERRCNTLDIIKKNDTTSVIVNSNKSQYKPISILVTAFNTFNYIEECLDSIVNQTYFKNNENYEILLGIDGCKKTLDKVLSISHKYKNLRIFMMDSNKGTYVTTNTLLDIVKYENILRFDSDDVMCNNLVETVLKYNDEFDIIRFSYFDFETNINNTINNRSNKYANGVILINKKVFDKCGGYQNWVCSADTELLLRITNFFRFKLLNQKLFYRRIHSESLTQKKETSENSIIRNSYHNSIRKYNINENIYIIKHVNKYKEYYVDLDINKIAILIVNLNNIEYTKKCINSLNNQTNKNFKVFLVDQNSDEIGTSEYLDECLNNNIIVIRNSDNFPLNHIWNNFKNLTNFKYLCFLNNDTILSSNYVDDTLKTFNDNIKIGIVIHVTNNNLHNKIKNKLEYIVLTEPMSQGWDFTIKREIYPDIPKELLIFGGDDYIFSKLCKYEYLVAMVYSSPIKHFKERTRCNINNIKEIQDNDKGNLYKIVANENLILTKSTTQNKICNKYPPKNFNLTQNKNCVYTAIIGDYDTLTTPTKIENNWDYICYTDNINLKSDVWRVIYINNLINIADSTKLSRYIKLNFNKFLSSYENILWIDGRISINCNLNDYLNHLDNNVDIIMVKHPYNNSIKEEFDNILKLKLEKKDIVDEIKTRYDNLNYNYDNGLIASGILLFKNNINTISFFNEWWYEVYNYSNRDQLSANFVLWNNKKVKYKIIDNVLGNSFIQNKRKSKRITYE